MPGMTSTLTWRQVDELRLTGKLIPNPNSTSELLQTLSGVRVAVEGAMLHVDPRSTSAGSRPSTQPEYDVYVVPVAVVEYIKYREVEPSPAVRIMQ